MPTKGIEKLAYVQNRPVDGRPIIATIFYQDGRFHLPYERGDELMLLESVDGQRTVYLAKEPAGGQRDLRMHVAELILQQTPLENAEKIAHAIAADIMNFGAILEKLDLMFEHGLRRLDVTQLVATELEYLFYNVRSIYDQLQRLIADIWQRTQVEGRDKQQLPGSFRKVIIHGNPPERRSSSQITERYGLPRGLADYYEAEADFLLLCRAVRDSVAHWGRSFTDGPIYALDDGFAVDISVLSLLEVRLLGVPTPIESQVRERSGAERSRGATRHPSDRAVRRSP